MKIRILAAAALLSSIALLALTGAAAAQTTCSSSDTEGDHESVACMGVVSVDASVPSGGSINITPVSDTSTLPNAPRSSYLGPAAQISVLGANGLPVSVSQMEICFTDSAMGNVYVWSSASGSWVYSATSHLSGMDCTSTWSGGTYTIN